MVGPVYHNSKVWGYYTPGIKLEGTRGELVGNNIRDVTIGIFAEFRVYDPDANVVTISENTITRSLTGIQGNRISEKSIIRSNTVKNSSEPVRTVFGQGGAPAELYGIVTDHGNVMDNTLISDEPVWDATTVLAHRTGNVFTVASSAGIVLGTGALFSYAGGRVAAFPVEKVSGNAITVNIDYAINFPMVVSGPLYYAAAFANGLSNGGIVARGKGRVYADSNVIVGHRNDISRQNGGSITATNHSARDCHAINVSDP
jgi:hypothetical protein